jgi:hypothetical protein
MATTQPGRNPYASTTPPSYGSRVDEASTAYGAPARTGRNGMGTAALVLGILSIVTCWLWYVGGILAILAIVFGVIGRQRAARGEASNRGSATAGLVTGVVGLVAVVAIVIAAVAFLNSPTGKCIQNNAGNSSAQQQCVK